jgi:hypothetical protein
MAESRSYWDVNVLIKKIQKIQNSDLRPQRKITIAPIRYAQAKFKQQLAACRERVGWRPPSEFKQNGPKFTLLEIIQKWRYMECVFREGYQRLHAQKRCNLMMLLSDKKATCSNCLANRQSSTG